MFFVNLLLGLFAYRPLLGYGPPSTSAELEEAVDSFFFVPTDVTPAVVLAMSAWIFYRRRHLLFSLPRRSGNPVAIALLLAAGFAVFTWSTWTRDPSLLGLSAFFNLLGFALLLTGMAGLRAASLPAAVLLFSIPIPAPLLNETLYRFQLWTAEYAGWILYQLGIPGFVSGDQIIQYGKRFVVIESCSGLRSVETLTMLAVLLVDLFRRRGWHAGLIIFAAPLVAFGLNGFRVVGLILNPHSRIAAIHTVQGVVVLLFGLVVLYLLDGLLARWLASGEAPDYLARPKGVEAPSQLRSSALIAVVLATLAAVAQWSTPWSVRPTPQVSTEDALRASLSDRVSRDLDARKFRFFLGTLGMRQMLYRSYDMETGPDNEVELFVGFGLHNHPQRSLVSPKTALPGSGWAVEYEDTVVVEPDGREVRERVLRSDTRRVLIYHWYEGVGGLAREGLRSFLALDRTPWQRQHEAVVVTMSTELAGPNEEHRKQGQAVLGQFYLSLREALSTQEIPL